MTTLRGAWRSLTGASLGRQQRQEERAAYLFLVPWFVGLALLLVVPITYAIYISMTNESLFEVGEFVGLDNYSRLFDDRLFLRSLEVTVRWIVLSTPVFMIASLAISLLLNQRLRGMNAFRTILYIPAVLSGVAVTVLWFVLLSGESGAVNQVLRSLGWSDPPFWFDDADWAMPAVVLMGLWGVGGGAVIFLAGLQNIPPHLYEAAGIDGAGPIAKFRHVTLPLLSPTLFFVLINLVVDGLLIFGPIFVISGGGYKGGPDDSLLFYMLYLYRKGFLEGQLGYAAALAWILTIVGTLLVWLTFRLEKRFVFYETEAPA